MNFIKSWLINVGLKEIGPSAIRGVILGASGWLAMRNGLLSNFGVVSDAASHTTTIHWDQLSIVAIAGLPAIGAAVIKILNYHASAAITGTPQSGSTPLPGPVTPK